MKIEGRNLVIYRIVYFTIVTGIVILIIIKG